METSDPLPEFKLDDDVSDRVAQAILKETLDLIAAPVVLGLGLDEKIRKAYFQLPEEKKLALHHRITRDVLWKTFLRVSEQLRVPPRSAQH